MTFKIDLTVQQLTIAYNALAEAARQGYWTKEIQYIMELTDKLLTTLCDPHKEEPDV